MPDESSGTVGPVLLGVDVLVHDAGARPLLSGRLGLLTNRAARAGDGRWTGEALIAAGFRISQLFAPEHGLDAASGAGAPVLHSRLGDVPVWSLYGGPPGAAEEALASLDALLIDLPDVGCRYYTYPWTVRDVLGIAARSSVQVWVLDRPNPLGGEVIEGSLPDAGFDSPVCSARVPIRHGLTLGELALWHVRELSLDLDIRVVPASGWRRSMIWPDVGLPWVPPSPGLRSYNAALAYPGTCLCEGTNLSEGRGTESPFELVGAPFLDGQSLARRLRQPPSYRGATVEAISFTPSSGKWAGMACQGITVRVADLALFHPVRFGLELIAAALRLPEFDFRAGHFDALAGGPGWRMALMAGIDPQEIAGGWAADEAWFRVRREGTLLYG